MKSKTLAEKAAWDFVATLDKGDKFELVTINPGFIVGPNLNSAHFSSGDMIKQIMMGEMPGLPKIQMPVVDVRDCATAHLEACLREEANGKRFILAERDAWFTEYGPLLHAKFGHRGYTGITTGEISKCLMWLVSFCDSQAAGIYKMWGLQTKCDNSATRSILGINFIPLEKSLEDMVPTLVSTGYMPDQFKK